MTTLTGRQFAVLFSESSSVAEAKLRYESEFGKDPLRFSLSPQVFFRIANVFWSKDMLAAKYGSAFSSFMSDPEMFSDEHVGTLIDFVENTAVFDSAFNVRYGDTEGVETKSLEDFENTFLCLNLLHNNIEKLVETARFDRKFTHNYMKFSFACEKKTFSLED